MLDASTSTEAVPSTSSIIQSPTPPPPLQPTTTSTSRQHSGDVDANGTSTGSDSDSDRESVAARRQSHHFASDREPKGQSGGGGEGKVDMKSAKDSRALRCHRTSQSQSRSRTSSNSALKKAYVCVARRRLLACLPSVVSCSVQPLDAASAAIQYTVYCTYNKTCVYSIQAVQT